MPQITTQAGKSFASNEGESLLDAALRCGVLLEHSCRTGRCSSCKAKVETGDTIALHDEMGLSQTERDAGWILTCVRCAISDVHMQAHDLGSAAQFPVRTWPCRIQTLQHLTTDVLQVVLRLPPSCEFDYYPGQYVDVIGPNGLRRSYSLANAPVANKILELHIRRVDGGAMSDYWFNQAQVNDLLRLNGPRGTFFLRELPGADLVFLATGTGIAPVKAMLESLQATPSETLPRSVVVYWGGRTREDIYWQPIANSPVQYRFVPVLSRADPDWSGARGYVQDVLFSENPDESRLLVYACGSGAMIQSALERMRRSGLPEGRFRSDAFVCSASNLP